MLFPGGGTAILWTNYFVDIWTALTICVIILGLIVQTLGDSCFFVSPYPKLARSLSGPLNQLKMMHRRRRPHFGACRADDVL